MRKSRQIRNKRSLPLLLVFLFLTFIFLVFIFFRVLTLDKFIYVNKTVAGDAEIIIVDSRNDKIIRYLIPAKTELISARGYGNYKLESLWILSQKDRIEGKLIAETISKNYALPIYLWKNEKRTNLTLLQRLKLLMVNRETNKYDLEFKSPKLSNSVLINFVENEFTQITPKIELVDLTGEQDLIEKISNIIEVVGGKIYTNSKGFDEDLDCEVRLKTDEMPRIFSKIFSCENMIDSSISTDIKIKLGVKFAERF